MKSAGVATMAKKAAKPPKSETAPTRLTVAAIDEARMAASIKGVSVVDYMSEIVLRTAKRDVDVWSRARAAASKQAETEGA